MHHRLLLRRQRQLSWATLAGGYVYIWYRRLRVYERQPISAQSLLAAAEAAPTQFGTTAPRAHAHSYADAFGVTLALPDALYRRALDHSSAAAGDPPADADADADAAAARFTTAFARSFFSSRSFTVERCVIAYALRLSPPPFQSVADVLRATAAANTPLAAATPALATTGPAVAPGVRDARGISFAAADCPVPNVFRVLSRRPSEVLLAWGMGSAKLSGLSWLSTRLYPAQPAPSGAADTPVVHVSLGSAVWQFPRDDRSERSVSAVMHRLYSKVCLYNALHDLIGCDPTPFVVAHTINAAAHPKHSAHSDSHFRTNVNAAGGTGAPHPPPRYPPQTPSRVFG